MTSAEYKWTPFLALLHREIMRFVKVIGQTVLTPMVNSTLYLLIFGLSLGGSIELSNGVQYLAFLIPGLIMMSALNNAYQNTSSSIISSKFHGDLIDLRTLPLGEYQIVFALALGGLARGLVVALMTLLVSEVFSFVAMGDWYVMEHPLWAILFLVLGGLTFSFMGMAVGFQANNFEKVNAIGSFILLPLLYLGGVFYSLEQLHPFWQTLSKLNPLLYLINGMRYGCLGVSDIPVETSLLVSVVAFGVLFSIAVRAVKYGSYTRW